ncbi:MAG: thiamine diphosphokinase [Trueperaceae bacterium]|nr:thiamine diphosphokinase [Trueperaceae bacterium]
MIALILAGGPLRPSPRLLRKVAEADVVIAADGGLRHAIPLGVTPDLLVGDLDSVREEDLMVWPDVPTERHPADKDALDLELAIEAALARGAECIRVIGAFGGRFDQTLATAWIAARYAEQGVDMSLLDGIHDAYPLPAGARFDDEVPSGTVFSLLSVSERSRVDVDGADYPLRDAELPRGVGLGLSNVAHDRLVVDVREGLVLLILEWDA